jgi:hypothetical protein
MRNYIVLFLLTLIFLSAKCYGQNVQDQVYIFFDVTSNENCESKKDGSTVLKSDKFKKVDTRNELTFFYIRDELFVFNKKTGVSDTLLIHDVPGEDIIDINEMIEIYKSQNPSQFKHHIFEEIFLLEKKPNNTLISYRVIWNDESLGIID